MRPARAHGCRRIGLLDGRVDLVSDQNELVELSARYFQHAPTPPGKADLEVHLSWTAGDTRRGFAVTTQPSDAFADSAVPEPRSPYLLARALTEWAVAHTPSHYVFHAGALAGDHGGLLLPGPSRSGKTTLTAGLLQRGFDFLSDEVAALDFETGLMQPFPRNLSIRDDVWSLLSLPDRREPPPFEWHFKGGMVTAETLGGRAFQGQVRPTLIVFPHFERGARLQLSRPNGGPAVMLLTEASCSVRRFKAAGLDFVINLVQNVPCYEMVFGDLEQGLDALVRLYREGAVA